jgi:hypothetical protein
MYKATRFPCERLLCRLHACIHSRFDVVRIEPQRTDLAHRDRLKLLCEILEEYLIGLQVGDHDAAAPDRGSLLPAFAPKIVREVIAPPQGIVDALLKRRIELNKLFNAAPPAYELTHGLVVLLGEVFVEHSAHRVPLVEERLRGRSPLECCLSKTQWPSLLRDL